MSHQNPNQNPNQNQKENNNQNSIIRRFQEAYKINRPLRNELQEYILVRMNLPSNRIQTTRMKEKHGPETLIYSIPNVLYRGITLYDQGEGSWKELYEVLKTLNNPNSKHIINKFMGKTHTISDVISFSKTLDIAKGFATRKRDQDGKGIPVVLELQINDDSHQDYIKKALNISKHRKRTEDFNYEHEVAYYMPSFKIYNIVNRKNGYYLVQANMVQLNIEKPVDPITLNDIKEDNLFIADKIPYSKKALIEYFLSKYGIASFKIPHSRKLLSEDQVFRLFHETPYLNHMKNILRIHQRRTNKSTNLNALDFQFATKIYEMVETAKHRNDDISRFVKKLKFTPNTSGTESFRNPKVLTKDQIIRKIMTKLRKVSKPQLQRLMTKLNN